MDDFRYYIINGIYCPYQIIVYSKTKAVDFRFGLGHNPHYCIKAIGNKTKYNIYNVDIDCF